jgi:hypothetical protein
MNVAELFALTHWINEEIKGKQILERYQSLQNILQANTNPNRTQQPFEAETKELLAAVSAVALESLSAEQVDFLRRIGIGDYVGPEAVQKIEDILFRNALDSATAAQKLGEMVDQITQGIQKSDHLAENLTGIVPPEPRLAGRVLVRVTFVKEAAITNVVDLRNWSDVWYDIGRGVAMINDAPPEDIHVVGAGTGSVIIELAVAYGVAKVIAAVILQALTVAEKVVDIRKKAEEIKNLKLSNAKIATELKDSAEAEKKKGIEAITEDVSGLKRKKDGVEGDKVVAFERAVTKLVDFLEKGGEVDCVLPEEESEQGEGPKAGEIKQLRATFREIRLLETRLVHLEDKKESPSAEEKP